VSDAGSIMKPEQKTKATEASKWNVNNWHWENKDWSSWAKDRLTELLTAVSVKVAGGAGTITVSEVSKVEGDAYTNIRKGKKMVGFDIKISLSWKGVLRDGDGTDICTAQGTAKVPNLCEDEDVYSVGSVTHEVQSGDSHADKLVAAFKKEGVEAIQAQLRAFVDELKEK